MNLRNFRALVVLLAALLPSCGDTQRADAKSRAASDDARDASSDGSASAGDTEVPDAAHDQAGMIDGGPDVSERCDRFGAPFDRAADGGLIVAGFVSISPELVYRGRYNWSVELRKPSGEGIGDAELKAKAFMPAHGHGTTPIMLKHTAGSSRYELNDVNLYMAGKWEVTLTVRSSAGNDRIEFRACPIDPPDAGDSDDGDDAGASSGRGHS